jgi:RNA polymerase I-specific transcription initiation factor RRN7
MDEVGPHSMKKRALKSDKKKKGRQSKADPKRKYSVTLKKGCTVDEGTVYHGARGRYHYFLCLQLIFRHQIAALTKLWDLPPEFEVKFAT